MDSVRAQTLSNRRNCWPTNLDDEISLRCVISYLHTLGLARKHVPTHSVELHVLGDASWRINTISTLAKNWTRSMHGRLAKASCSFCIGNPPPNPIWSHQISSESSMGSVDKRVSDPSIKAERCLLHSWWIGCYLLELAAALPGCQYMQCNCNPPWSWFMTETGHGTKLWGGRKGHGGSDAMIASLTFPHLFQKGSMTKR